MSERSGFFDVVNLNADASCLPARKWLRCLEGGEESVLVHSLSNYVRHRRKVNLGIIGATVKDIACFNPEAIDLINDHPDIFEITVRPFAHDNPLLRIPEGFRFNLEAGMAVLRHYFEQINEFYLAPEIMVTSEQIAIVEELGIRGTFVHQARYPEDVRRRIPDTPFRVRGVLDSSTICLPFSEMETEAAYLRALHGAEPADTWPTLIQRSRASHTFLWRDGESCFLLPGGIENERRIFEAEVEAGITRRFLSEVRDEEVGKSPDLSQLRYFPMASMKPWLDELKLFWFTARIRDIEVRLDEIPDELRRFWLLLINSDILSSVEKRAPVVDVDPALFESVEPSEWYEAVPIPEKHQVVLTRSERAGEGEDYLAHFNGLVSGKLDYQAVLEAWKGSEEPHLRKGHARLGHDVASAT